MAEVVADGGLLEREPELAVLARGVARATRGRGGALAIVGPGGAGKTSLLDHVCEISTGKVLRATGRELELDFPFGVVRQLLATEIQEELEGRTASVIGAVQLAAPVFRPDPGPARPASALLHGLYWMIADLAEQTPLTIAVDDAQWADLASLQFICELAQQVRDLPVLLVVAVRRGDPAAARPGVEQLLERDELELLTPGPLSEAAVGELLVAAGFDASRASSVRDATGGNPFLTRELLRGGLGTDAGGTVPGTVAHAIATRLGRLGEDAVSLAQAVSILGDGCEPIEAALLAGLSPEQAAVEASALARAEFLRSEPQLTFVHPLVRAAVDGQLGESAAGALHRRAAQMLLSRGAARERIVAQLLSCPSATDPDAARLLVEAGAEALRMSSAATAVAYLRRAIAEGAAVDDGAVLGDLGQAELWAGRPEAAIEALGPSAARATDPRAIADRVRLLWLAHVNAGRFAAGLSVLEAAITRIGDTDREARLMLEAEFTTAGVVDVSLLGEAWGRLKPFTELAGETPAERHLLAQSIMREASGDHARAADVGRIARRAYGDGTFILENAVDTTQWVWVIGGLILSEQFELVEEALRRAQTSAEQIGSLETLTTIYDLRALLGLRIGRLASAEADALYGLTRLREVSITPIRDLIQVGLVRFALGALVARGRLDAAERLLHDYGFAGQFASEFRHSKLLVHRAALRLAQGRLADALADTAANADFNAANGLEDVADAPWRPIAAVALAQLGDHDRGRAVADRHLELADAWGIPRNVAAALRVRAIVEPLLSERIPRLREAAAALGSVDAPVEEAVICADLGEALLDNGEPRAAREVLRIALDRATRIGALGLQERTYARLRAAGARPRRPTIRGADSLTPSEREIATLAASGRRNREIAETQFLSVRTVENTLQRVYGKLQIRTRADLAAALDLGPGDAT